jgi:hypothetical protein
MAGALGVLFRGGVERVRGKVVVGNRALRGLVAFATTLAIAISPQASFAQAASLPGKSGVSSSGGATYSVPISVPPGTAGMIPSLSLDYNSQSGASNGWLGAGVVGIGWSLSGLPAIGRCPRSVVQDGAAGAVNYDANDRFCLDGQRLIATTGAYGADGTEYRTEIESFSKIISHGTAGTGPAWFEVRSKSGQILQFGNTTASRILAQGKTTARSWGVNKVSDTKGNYFTVTYVNDAVNGQAYPSRIDYTGNDAASLAPYNSVQFVYDTSRTDILPIYHAGSLIKTTVRLTKVQTYSGSSLVGDYRLAYQQGSATERSQLVSVTLCDGASNCLPATSFTWQNGTQTPSVTANVAGQNGTLSGSVPYLGDFNGDGLTDILWDAEQNSMSGVPLSSGTRTLWTNTGSNSFSVTSNVAGQNGALIGYLPIVADFNRDGRTDVWWYPYSGSGSIATWNSTNGATLTVGTGPSHPGSAHLLAGVTDINGDFRSDLLWYLSSGPTLTAWITNANGTITAINSTAPSGGMGSPQGWGASLPRAVDFNGDGLGDVLWSTLASGKRALWLGAGNGTFTEFSAVDLSVTGYNANYLDINGDGNTDVLWDHADSNGRSTGQRILWISKGDGTFDVNANPGGLNGTLSGYSLVAADFNGDGIADIFWTQVDTNGLSTGARVVWIGKGDGTFTVLANFGNQDGTLISYVPVLADFNGDGKTDVLWDSRSGSDKRSTGTRTFWLSDGVTPDIITVATTGSGATSTFTYKSLTDSTVYTKDNSATDPIADVQMPMRVVSRVDSSNGIGGTLAIGYAYVGAKVHQDGRGFLGFRQMKVTDLQTNILQTTTYRQDYPYLYLVASDTQTLGASTLSATTNTYGSTALGGTRYQVFQTQSQASKNDLDGTALPTATTAYQYDAYSNATQVSVTTSDGYSKTTNNTYTNDTSNWLLGRLTASSVTAQAPQQLGQYCSLPWGGTISNGQSVTAYSAATAPVGQACSTIAQTRTCTNGTLSGSHAQQTCSAVCALPWGGTIGQGQTVTAYSVASKPPGQLCSAAVETRTCGASGTLSGSFANQSCTNTTVTLSSSTSNINLWNHLVANGWSNSGQPGTWIVSIASGVVIGSGSTGTPAFDTGTFPAGSTLQLTNNGTITGRGGAGGSGGAGCVAGSVGGAGGTGLQARLATVLTNNGSIRGGGGGGGGGAGRSGGQAGSFGGGGGGAGAGLIASSGGAGGSASTSGSAGGSSGLDAAGAGGAGGSAFGVSAASGGAGGGPGLAGSSGDGSICAGGGAAGAAGSAVLGNSFITWSTIGDRRGPLN